MSIITYVPNPTYGSSVKGIINAGGGTAYDVGAALTSGGGVITVDSSTNSGLVSALDNFPGVIRQGVTPGPVTSVDVIAPLFAHSGTNPQVGDILTRGVDGLFAPGPPSGTLPGGTVTDSRGSANQDLLVFNGTSFVRLPVGATDTVMTVRSDGTISYTVPPAISARAWGAGPTATSAANTTALQSAVAQAAINGGRGDGAHAAGRINLTAGTFQINAALLAKYGVKLYGVGGIGNTIIKADPAAPLANFTNGSRSNFPALIKWDGGDDFAHGVHVVGISFDTSGIPGLSATWFQSTGENSWFDDLSCDSCVAVARTVTDAQLTAGSSTVTFTTSTVTEDDVNAIITMGGNVAAPGAPTVTASGTGSTLPGGQTFTVGITYLTANGETLVSATSTVTPTAGQNIVISSPPLVTGATGWFAYVSQAGGGGVMTRQQAPGAATAINTSLTMTAPPSSTGANPYNKIDRIGWGTNSNAATATSMVMRNPAAATLSNVTMVINRPTDAFVFEGAGVTLSGGTPACFGQFHGVKNSGALVRLKHWGGTTIFNQLSGDDNVGGMCRGSSCAQSADPALLQINNIKSESDTYNTNWQYAMDPVILLDRCWTMAVNILGGTFSGNGYVRDLVRLDNSWANADVGGPSVWLAGVEGQNWYNTAYVNILHDTNNGVTQPASAYGDQHPYPMVFYSRNIKLSGGANLYVNGAIAAPVPSEQADGDVLVGSGGSWARLARGTTGQVLVVRSDGTVFWTDPPMVSVKAWLAKGDGTSVDTTPVQNAVTALLGLGGGVLYYPTGTYIQAMVTYGSNITVRGAGKGATTLQMDPAVYTNTGLYGTVSTALVARVAPASSVNSTSKFRMEHLTLDGNKAVWGNGTTNRMMGFYMGQGTAGLVSDCSMGHVEIRNCMTYGFDIENVSQVRLEFCDSHDNGYTTGTGTHLNADGFTLIGDDITCTGCNSWNNAVNGYLGGQAGVTWHRVNLMGCKAWSNGASGANLGSSTGFNLIGAKVIGGAYYSNTGAGVTLNTGAQGCSVIGVYATGNGTNGILLSGASNNTVSANTVQNNATSASSQPEIYLTNSSTNNSVTGNTVSSTTSTHAISEQNSTTDYNSIMGNTVSSTSTTIVPAGIHSQVRNNPGYNPIGTVTVTVPATGVAVAAVPYDRTFYVTASTAAVTWAFSPGPSLTIPANAFVPIRVPAGVAFTPSATVMPTWLVEAE